MQIQEYLYAIRRRLWLPVAVPLAAAVITAGVLYIQPERYEATATVIVPALSGQGYSTSAVTQYVSTYKDVLVSTPVVNFVSLTTGEKAKDIIAGLSADTATASSNIITVTYIGPNKKTASPVVQAAAIEALDVLLGPQKARANLEVATSQDALNTANQAIADYADQTGIPDPVAQQKNLLSELSVFTGQLYYAKLGGATKQRIAGLNTITSQYRDQLVAIAPIVVHYQELLQRQASANEVYNKSLEDQNKVNAEIASDHDPAAVTYRFIGHLSRVPDMVKFGAIALAIGLVLTIGFIVFLEFYRPEVAKVPYLRRLVAPLSSAPLPVVVADVPEVAAMPEVATVPAVAVGAGTEAGPSSNGNGHSNGDGPGAAKAAPVRSKSRK